MFDTDEEASVYHMVCTTPTSDRTSLSPMRHLLSGSFVEHIRKILTRNTSNPLLNRSAKKTRDLTQKDCLEILTEAQQVFREEYIQKQYRAKEEIDKRISVLKDQKQKQQEDLESLLNNQRSVKSKAEELAEKIEDVAAQDIDLMDR
ncbi:Nuclear pore complex protein Nup88 [Exaiptasia diaphana]|nr:Nuclear pore complex protein Nup88 [Exaiptasia diaphana]